MENARAVIWNCEAMRYSLEGVATLSLSMRKVAQCFSHLSSPRVPSFLKLEPVDLVFLPSSWPGNHWHMQLITFLLRHYLHSQPTTCPLHCVPCSRAWMCHLLRYQAPASQFWVYENLVRRGCNLSENTQSPGGEMPDRFTNHSGSDEYFLDPHPKK